MKLITYFTKMSHFVGITRVRSTGIDLGIVGHYPYRVPIQAGQASDGRNSKSRLDLEKTFAVKDQFDNTSHVVGMHPVAGYNGQQFFLPAVRWIASRHIGGHLPNVLRHVAQESFNL